jgi:signal transduction histidine kinase
VAFAGCILLIIRRPEHWGAGFGMLGLNLIGHIVTILYPVSGGDYSGVVRLVQMASYPILFTLTQRMPAPRRRMMPASIDAETEQTTTVIEAETHFPPSFFQDLSTLEDAFHNEEWNNVARFICQTMQAGHGLIISSPNEEGEVSILGEYPVDTDKERSDKLNIKLKQIPLLSNALLRGRGLILPAENNSQDLTNLKPLLNSTEDGNLLAAPISTTEQNMEWGIILYRAEKGWSGEELAQLTSLGHILEQIQTRSGQPLISKNEVSDFSVSSTADLDLSQLDKELRSVLIETQTKNKELTEALRVVSEEAAKVPVLIKREKELQTILSKAQIQIKESKTALEKASQEAQKIPTLIAHEKELGDMITSLQSQIEGLREELLKTQHEADKVQVLEQNGRELQASVIEAKAQTERMSKMITALEQAKQKAIIQIEELQQEKNNQAQSLLQQIGEKDEHILLLQSNLEQLEIDHKNKLNELEITFSEQVKLRDKERLSQLEHVEKENNIHIENLEKEKNSQIKNLEKEKNSQIENLEKEKALQIDRLQKQLHSTFSKAKEQDERKSQEIKRLEKELRVTLASIDQIKHHLSQSEQMAIETREQFTQLSSQQMTEVASAAQELRHPLSAIMDYSDLLLDESVGALGALQRKFLEKIKESIKSLEDRINTLIQSTVLDSTKVHLFSHTVDVKTILDTALEIAHNSVQQKNLHVNVFLPQEMPLLLTDREALQQVLLYLIHHATTATPPNGKINIMVRLEAKDEQKHILLQVSDSGEGIPPEELSQVFSPLYRPSRYATSDGEVEMGLSIAKTLVDALKGRIWVDSEENKGSTFSVYLPVVTAETDGQIATIENK